MSVFQTFLLIGAIMGFLAVAFGAFGAHALKSRIPEERLSAFHTGVQYQMYHALGLMILAVTCGYVGNQNLVLWAGCLFIVGIVLFSGSLYALCLTGKRALGAITPLGGVAFLVGWALLIFAAVSGFTA
jgi:uncharacterized membrane protein YgdD (TMEM256/DUF423 family)